MRNPHVWRNVGIASVLVGIVAGVATFLLPETVAGTAVRTSLFVLGATAALFGGGTALFRHFDVRQQTALQCGENVIARWQVDPALWQDFIALNQTLNQEGGARINELTTRNEARSEAIQVVVGKTAAEIDGSIHALPERGTPEVTHASLIVGHGRVPCVELRLYYPAHGAGASGMLRRATRTSLRFPVGRGAEPDAARVVAYFQGNRAGKPDFFHGAGDGTDSEDLSKCAKCGYETHKLVSHCPQCGASMLSKRWARRFGGVICAGGAFITALISVVIYKAAPPLLNPDSSVGGVRFSGTRSQALIVLGIFGLVLALGVSAMIYGLYQVRTGRRHRRLPSMS